jgi:hypothetical protein
VGRHELITLEDGERWTAALADVPHGHAHTHGFCSAVQLTSGLRLHGLRPRLARVRPRTRLGLRLHRPQPSLRRRRSVPDEEVRVQNTLYVLDLSQESIRLWAALSQNRRRQLRDWDSISGRLEVDRARLAGFLVDDFGDFFARKGAGQLQLSPSS